VLPPAGTVRSDVGVLPDHPHLSRHERVSGYAYDLSTGLLETAAPADVADA
jgi:hypothetical protein